MLKSIEFAGASREDEKGQNRSLEVLLLEKNKALQSENTQLKVSSADLAGRKYVLYFAFSKNKLPRSYVSVLAGLTVSVFTRLNVNKLAKLNVN